MKFVSVIVPVYNIEQYVAFAVKSVLDQTYSHFELLIVDDGSCDRSLEICQQFTDSRIRVIHQENRGLAGARNTGIRAAKGELIALLDGDDCWLPEKLEKHVAHLERSPQVGISFSCSEFIDEAGKRLGTFTRPTLNNIDVERLLKENPVANGSAAVIRQEVFSQIAFEDNLHGVPEAFYFDEAFRRSEDLECWLRVALQTDWEIEGIPDELTLYRVNSGGLSANLFKQFESWEMMVDKARTLAPGKVSPLANMSLAYGLRYLSRNAIRLKSGQDAVYFINQSLSKYWKIVLEEPRRTLLTFLVAYLLWFLPESVYQKIKVLDNL